MHDGNHVAFTSNKLISKIAGYTLELTFSSSVVYRRSHDFGHHGCANHYELDRSFDTTFPLIRLHRMQPKLWFHKYQQIYVWFVYGLTNFGDLFGTFDEIYWMSNFPSRQGFCSNFQVFSQAIIKMIWFITLIIIPTYLHGYLWAFPIWMLYMVIFSYSYALFFAVNHWTDEANFTDNSNINNTDWGIMQIQNSCNFALDSTFWSHICGGLNFQIEHHLAPGYSHTRLFEISQVVQEYCKQNNVKYVTYNTFWDALKGHYNLLKKLGESE
ncbi:linoleoyl- desaturase, putative [Ichthyophthirius multifiliis]|uniref:Linoleoyl-desaturase, putative n=1 Tax=Ichthyophthirius multifiliis TaxID=5932 RepID=G0QWH1_ICHMU|nr:linoleoyl- desaturase, putative [Ichthyophthirius multifiliis]EGR30432.1 linoleoyl- desaturase, putative [Ichthyophthirius multifiliis]|eukprot:XP_004032019.1 linoleoyl- desaturase, putative [Ichthyophthirius multifiliis]